MLFLIIKDYHRVESEQRFSFGIPSISEEITDWIEKIWAKHQVNLFVFAYDWINIFLKMKMFGLQRIERRVNILGESMIISRKEISSTLIHSIERCRKKTFIKGRK